MSELTRILCPTRATRAEAARVVELLPALYAAAGDAALWPTFLREYALVVRGEFAHVWWSMGDFGAIDHVGLDERSISLWTEYNAYYHRVNPSIPCLQAFGPGTATSAMRLCGGLSQFRATEYWDGLHRPHQVDDELGITGLIDIPGGRVMALSVMRRLRAAAFGESEQRIAGALGAHFATATRIAMRVRSLPPGHEPSLLDRLDCAALVVDQRGRPVQHNEAMRELARSGWLRLASGRRPLLDSTTATRALQRAVAGVAATASGEALHAGQRLALATRQGTLIVYVSPFCGRAPNGDPILGALVLARPVPRQGLHCLTPTQRRVAELLSRGLRIADTADALEISAETVRTHVKAIYERLGIGSRAELAGVAG